MPGRRCPIGVKQERRVSEGGVGPGVSQVRSATGAVETSVSDRAPAAAELFAQDGVPAGEPVQHPGGAVPR